MVEHVRPFVRAVDVFIEKQDEVSFNTMLAARETLTAAYVTKH